MTDRDRGRYECVENGYLVECDNCGMAHIYEDEVAGAVVEKMHRNCRVLKGRNAGRRLEPKSVSELVPLTRAQVLKLCGKLGMTPEELGVNLPEE